MKPIELQAMSDEQLSLTRKDTIKHLFQLRFQSATDRLETPSELRKARRDIARINTVTRQRELSKLAGLSDDQLKQKIRDIDAAAKKLDGMGDRRKARRDAARIKNMLRARAEKKKAPVGK